MNQLAMVGDDWKSDRQRSSEAKAKAAQKKAALQLAAKLSAAADAMNVFLSACTEVHGREATYRADDGRRLLMEDMCEYRAYLESVFGDR